MSDEKAIIVKDQVQLGALAVAPEAVVETATRIATVLAKVITDRGLFKVLKDRKYVMVEGWSTLGAMIGVLPKEEWVKKLDDGSYEAKVELVRTSDGVVVGGASALCGMDETWGSRAEYARRSMAITRATGKAYRLGFSWIIKLAGYEATPAEEMDFVEGEVHEAPKAEAPSPSVQISKAERPLSPTLLKSFLSKKADKYGEKAASDSQRGLARGMMSECFPDEASDEKVHSVTKYLFGTTSTKELSGAEIAALLDWLKPEKDSGGAYHADPMAISEAQSVLTSAMAEAGQEALFGK